MRTLTLIVLLCIQPCFARAEWPFDQPKEAAWPFASKPCDCNPCTCDPATCTCANCANGCRNAVGQATYTVGMVDDPFNMAPTTPTVQAPVQTYHTEYRQVCNGSSCQMVAVSVPDAPRAATFAAGSTCPCCGMVMNAEQAAKMNVTCPNGVCQPQTMYGSPMMGACANGSCGNGDDGTGAASGRTGPIRRIFGRIFRGRKGGGCCGG